MAITETLKDGVIVARCDVCLRTKKVPNKGLGRANLAAWKSQHQHAAGAPRA